MKYLKKYNESVKDFLKPKENEQILKEYDKFIKIVNESIKDYLKPKSDDKIDDELFKLPPSEILRKSINNKYMKGIEYLILNDLIPPQRILKLSMDYRLKYGYQHLVDKNLVDDTTKYLIEKYEFGLHQNEMKDYEKVLLDCIENCIIKPSKIDHMLDYYVLNESILHEFMLDSNILLHYNRGYDYIHYNFRVIYDIIKIKDLDISILIRGLFNKYLGKKVKYANRKFS